VSEPIVFIGGVATDDAHLAALATDEGTGATRDDEPAIILTWRFDGK